MMHKRAIKLKKVIGKADDLLFVTEIIFGWLSPCKAPRGLPQ